MTASERESIGADELEQALIKYAEKANASPRARKTLGTWSCRIHVEAIDVPDARFTHVIEQGASQPVCRGLDGVPDLIVQGHSMDLAEIFWGDVPLLFLVLVAGVVTVYVFTYLPRLERREAQELVARRAARAAARAGRANRFL